ncbi:MAG: MFS transporter [Actinomycetota bacterium]|nr:MFS transporter [Actinomycetota bacterium]
MLVRSRYTLVITLLFGGYASFGAFWGVWVVVFGDFLARHQLSEAGASLLLAALSVSSIATMTVVAPSLVKLPRRISVGLALALNGVAVLLLGIAPSGWLVAAFVLTGVGTGLIDVFMSLAGQQLETSESKPVLQWVHAGYSAGAAVGALGAAFLLQSGFEPWTAIAATAVLQVSAAAASFFLGDWPEAPAQTARAPRLSLSVFVAAPALLLPSVVLLAAFFIEGSMDVWSVLYLRRTLGASVTVGAFGFAAFATASAVGRAFAARVLFGLGYRRTLLVSGLSSMAAGAVAILTTSPVVAGGAFLVLGFTVSAAAPAAFGLGTAGRTDPGVVIAAMTTVGYGGFVLGPPISGWLASSFGLRATMTLVVASTIGIAAGALFHRKPAGP